MNRLLIFISLISAGCAVKKKDPPVRPVNFTLPVIIQEIGIDTMKPYAAENITEVYPRFIGKYKFGDTIFYKDGRERGLVSREEYMWETEPIFNNDSLSSDGLEIIADYNTSVSCKFWDEGKYLYYPVYVINQTSKTKVFFGKDGHGFAIQEAAVDTSEYVSWHPIEAQGVEFCGNGSFRKKLNPGEFLMFVMAKYSGTLKTKLRIRFRIGENIFISRSFNGIIDPRQFLIDKKDWMHKELKATKGYAYHWYFYGGIPKEIDNY